MTRPPILQSCIDDTFSKYFELPYAPADILAEFDLKYERKRLDLPRYEEKLNCLEFLSRYLQRNLTYVNPISETARREVLIAPTLLEICAETHAQLNIEYPVNVNEKLKGSFDYYINGDVGMLVRVASLSREK
ncbi:MULTISPECIES: hypothetical protein [Nostocales]|uniref:hypothetical protein n=1 Tax=Nostocales TaxID=1161 RepID=UPI001F55364F|nr:MULTISPECIES: hypothetical protein [Nostocales]